jgi:hypothetical protein
MPDELNLSNPKPATSRRDLERAELPREAKS